MNKQQPTGKINSSIKCVNNINFGKSALPIFTAVKTSYRNELLYNPDIKTIYISRFAFF